MRMADVDVVVPCYKYGHYLRQCVESILGQEGVGLRVLIIDDASPDETERVARELMSQDDRVEYRRHSVNMGAVGTANEGILHWARGEYTVLLSADDLLTPGALARAVRVLDTYPDVGFVHGRAIRFQGSPPRDDPRLTHGAGLVRLITGPQFIDALGVHGAHVSAPTVMVRTSLQQQLGGYRHDLPFHHDGEMWLRLAAHASVGTLDSYQALYRWHGTNLSTEYNPLKALGLWRVALDAFFDRYAARIEGGERLRQFALRRLAERAFWSASRAFDAGDVRVCEEYLALSLAADLTIRSSRPWLHMRCKRFLGPQLWQALAPILRKWRSRRTTRRAEPSQASAEISALTDMGSWLPSLVDEDGHVHHH
jgi:glycosyltransferase involved in cell wall biosynthesis